MGLQEKIGISAIFALKMMQQQQFQLPIWPQSHVHHYPPGVLLKQGTLRLTELPGDCCSRLHLQSQQLLQERRALCLATGGRELPAPSVESECSLWSTHMNLVSYSEFEGNLRTQKFEPLSLKLDTWSLLARSQQSSETPSK